MSLVVFGYASHMAARAYSGLHRAIQICEEDTFAVNFSYIGVTE